jgi:hypothetical protein
MFGKPRKVVSIADMNAVIAKRGASAKPVTAKPSNKKAASK